MAKAFNPGVTSDGAAPWGSSPGGYFSYPSGTIDFSELLPTEVVVILSRSTITNHNNLNSTGGGAMTAIKTTSDKYLLGGFLCIVAIVSYILLKIIIGSDGL